MNRSSIAWLSLSVIFAAGFMMACGPTMKPVEYEDPNKGMSSRGDYEESPSSSDESTSASATKSASADDSAADDSPKATSEGSCKNKKCGETCSDCPPDDENCMEILVLKQCDLKGACVPAKVECSAASEKDAKSKDSKTKSKSSK